MTSPTPSNRSSSRSSNPARDLADQLLARALPQRWDHTQGVATRASVYAQVLGLDAETCEAAAWLHDIGYAPELATTGFPALDGARHLRDAGYPMAVCTLVAHRSGALVEAQERGLDGVLVQEFGAPDDRDDLLAVLTTSDMTTTADGGMTAVEDRVADMLELGEASEVVHRAMSRSGPALIETSNGVLRAVKKASRN